MQPDIAYPSFRLDMPFHDYLAVDAVSKSALKRLITHSPAHSRLPVEPSAAIDLGSAIDTMVFEPHLFAEQFFLAAETVRRGTKAWAALEEQANGRTILLPAQADAIHAMHNALLAHDAAREIMSGAQFQASLFWRYGEHQHPAKARLDILNTEIGCIADLKTTKDVSANPFYNRVRDNLYHVQQAHYINGVREVYGIDLPFVFIAVETEPPYGVMTWELPFELARRGQQLLDYGLERYDQCRISGEWPCYPQTIQKLQRINYG